MNRATIRLRKMLTWLVVGLSLSCAPRPILEGVHSSTASAQPTPDIFDVPSTWTFVELDTSGDIARTVTLTFLDSIADYSCIGGVWREISIQDEDPARSVEFQGLPSYNLDGALLTIGFTSNLCDNYDEYAGRITDLGFVGHAENTWLSGSSIRGKVYGTRVPPAQ